VSELREVIMARLLRLCWSLAAGFLIASLMVSPCFAQTSDLNPDVGEFVGDAVHYVSLLRDGTTLGHWLDTRNPNDQWAEYEEECASYFTIDRSPSGILIPWKLHFYPPPVPTPVAFPNHGSRRDCVLGTVQVEAEDRGHPDLAKLMDTATREVITWKYGQSIDSEDAPFWGPYSYPDTARWISNAEIISGHSSEVSHCNDLHGPLLAMGDTAFVCAHSALVRRQELDLARSYRYRELDDSQFHRALAIAGADSTLTEKLQNLYNQILHDNGERLQNLFQRSVDGSNAPALQSPGWVPSLLPLLQAWLAQVKTFPAERRAAGLLVAHHLLLAAETAGGMVGWPLQRDIEQSLKKLSAELTPSEAENGVYAGSWAKQARQLDPGGVVGQMAIIGSMAHASCDGQDSDDPSRKVILEGEMFLSKGLNAQTAAQVHFMVGDAYSDFVALAKQKLNAQGARDPNKYSGEAGLDRAKALEHYRAGMAVDNASQNAQDAWRQAWRLLAGIQPEMRYVCFDEGGD
jgi:hypothetical protein